MTRLPSVPQARVRGTSRHPTEHSHENGHLERSVPRYLTRDQALSHRAWEQGGRVLLFIAQSVRAMWGTDGTLGIEPSFSFVEEPQTNGVVAVQQP